MSESERVGVHLARQHTDHLRYYDHDGDGYWRQCRYCGAFAQLKYNGKVTGDVLRHMLPCPVAELEGLEPTP